MQVSQEVVLKCNKCKKANAINAREFKTFNCFNCHKENVIEDAVLTGVLGWKRCTECRVVKFWDTKGAMCPDCASAAPPPEYSDDDDDGAASSGNKLGRNATSRESVDLEAGKYNHLQLFCIRESTYFTVQKPFTVKYPQMYEQNDGIFHTTLRLKDMQGRCSYASDEIEMHLMLKKEETKWLPYKATYNILKSLYLLIIIPAAFGDGHLWAPMVASALNILAALWFLKNQFKLNFDRLQMFHVIKFLNMFVDIAMLDASSKKSRSAYFAIALLVIDFVTNIVFYFRLYRVALTCWKEMVTFFKFCFFMGLVFLGFAINMECKKEWCKD